MPEGRSIASTQSRNIVLLTADVNRYSTSTQRIYAHRHTIPNSVGSLTAWIDGKGNDFAAKDSALGKPPTRRIEKRNINIAEIQNRLRLQNIFTWR